MMNEVKDEPAKPPLEELLKHSKIVTFHKECTRPKLDNLKRILEAVDGAKFKNDTPVALVAVIGPEKSGKSFLTNFVIQYLKQGGEGGWMSSSMTQNGFAEGFSFGSISSEKLFEPDPSSGSTSGVYLWPEPFLMTKTDEKNLVVWVMHVHSVHGESKENLAALERFLMLTCSRIMEIKWKNDDEFRILQHRQFLSDYDPTLQEQTCDSVVYTFRCGTKISAGTDEEAVETLRELLQEVGNCETTFLSSLRNCKHVNITWMNDFPYPLHDNYGKFSAKMKTVQKPIRNIVDKMLEESEINPKCAGGHPLTLDTLLQFVEAAANRVLASNPASRNQDLKPVHDNYICQAANNTQTGLVESSDADTGKLTNGNGTCPIPQNNQNISDVKRITTTTLGNLLESGDESHHSPLTRSLVKRESFPSESIGPLTTTNAKVEGANETSLPSSDKEEEFKNVSVGKDHNQNSSNIAKQEIHQSTHVAPVSPPAAVASKLCSSNQKVELLNNLISQMKVDSPSPHGTAEVSTEPEPEGNGRNSTEPEPMDVDDDVVVEEAVSKLQDEKNNESEFKKKQQEEIMLAQKLERERNQQEANQQQELIRKKEQEKQKRKEENKRKEEEARKQMMECFSIAVIQVPQILPHSIQTWMDKHFSFSNLNKIETIYAHSFSGTIEEHRKVVHPKLWTEFASLVDNHCKKECITVLRSISEPVVQLNRAVKKQFDFHGYFNSPKLEKMFSEEFQKLKLPQDEFASAMIKLATDKLLLIYQQHTEIVIENEKSNFKIASSQIENLYHEQMKRYMQDAPYSPQKLESIHKKLTAKLVDSLKRAFHLSNNADSFIATLEGPLKETIDKKYKSYENSNELKLKKLQSEINSIILKSRMKYNEKIEAVLSQYPDGVEARILTKHNDSIRFEAMKLLEMEVRSKVREDEPVEIHQKVLQSHIDGYWPTVLGANRNNIKRWKEKDEEKQRQQKMAEAQRKLDQKNEAFEARKSCTSSSSVPLNPQHDQNISNRKSMTQVDTKPPLLTPLVFHLQSSRIVMAMDINGYPTILENDSKEKQTPACVAFNSENKFVYGSAALALANDEKSDSETIRFWSVADFFINSCSSRTIQVYIDGNGTEHEVTVELLLAVLLSNLKETVEDQMQGQFTTTVIVIPFSFSSPQRIQVKHAAKIAGFSEVYLVNESSAAAYNFILSPIRSDSAAEVLVLSENFDLVDAFVYQYNGFTKKLIMLAHANNYETETEKKKTSTWKKITKGFSHAMNSLLNYLSASPNDTKQDDVTTASVRNASKHAIDEACSSKSKPVDLMESLYICENLERWGETLRTVARDFGRKPSDINQENAVIVGAVALSKNPKEIGRSVRDKLAYNVLRTQLPVGAVMVGSKRDQLPVDSVKHQTSLSGGVCETLFFQHVLGNNHDIGSLCVSDRVPQNEYIEPSIDITNEGIVKFKYVTKNSLHSNMRSFTNEFIPEAKITWKTPNLTDEQLAMMISLLDSLKIPKEDPALVQAKTCLFEKCQEMEEKIADDKFKFRSDLAKDMVTKNIGEAKQFATHARASLDDVAKQMDSLQRLCDKYEKK